MIMMMLTRLLLARNFCEITGRLSKINLRVENYFKGAIEYKIFMEECNVDDGLPNCNRLSVEMSEFANKF